jgi:hypothetical protein
MYVVHNCGRHELRRATRSTLQRVHNSIEVGGGIFENLLWDVLDVDEARFCPLQIISNTMVNTCMHVMLVVISFFVIAVRTRRMVRIFFLPYLGNRSKSDPCSLWTFLLRITHTIIFQNIADSSFITLYIQTCVITTRSYGVLERQ